MRVAALVCFRTESSRRAAIALTVACTVTAAAISRSPDDSFHDRYRRRRLLWRKKTARMTNTGRPAASQLASLAYLWTNAPAEPKAEAPVGWITIGAGLILLG